MAQTNVTGITVSLSSTSAIRRQIVQMDLMSRIVFTIVKKMSTCVTMEQLHDHHFWDIVSW
jgi:hypothetical protein